MDWESSKVPMRNWQSTSSWHSDSQDRRDGLANIQPLQQQAGSTSRGTYISGFVIHDPEGFICAHGLKLAVHGAKP